MLIYGKNKRANKMNNRLKEVEIVCEEQLGEFGGIAFKLRYEKRISTRSWARYDWQQAKERAYRKALRECDKWHKKGKRAWITSSGCEMSRYSYYVTHD